MTICCCTLPLINPKACETCSSNSHIKRAMVDAETKLSQYWLEESISNEVDLERLQQWLDAVKAKREKKDA